MTLYDRLVTNFLFSVIDVVGDLDIDDKLKVLNCYKKGYTVKEAVAHIRPPQLKLYEWEIWPDYEVYYFVAIAESPEDALLLIADRLSDNQHPQSDLKDDILKELRANEPKEYPLTEKFAGGVTYSG